jgi:hypothetical protein
MLLAVLAPCAALRTRSPVVRSSQPVLRALRGGATTEDSSLLWVRNGTSALQVVRSLSAFCEEHGLDEEAMLAVSRGEADDHDGWTCGAAQEYDPPPAAAVLAEEVPAAEDSKEGAAESAEGEASEEEAESVAASPPPVQQPMSKMIVGLVAPLIVLQVPCRPPSTNGRTATASPNRHRSRAVGGRSSVGSALLVNRARTWRP